MPTRVRATPTNIFIALKGATSFFAALTYTVELIYFAQVVRLNPLQLVLVGTSQHVVSFLMQAPTGAWADVYSRRWAIVLGFMLARSSSPPAALLYLWSASRDTPATASVTEGKL